MLQTTLVYKCVRKQDRNWPQCLGVTSHADHHDQLMTLEPQVSLHTTLLDLTSQLLLHDIYKASTHTQGDRLFSQSGCCPDVFHVPM